MISIFVLELLKTQMSEIGEIPAELIEDFGHDDSEEMVDVTDMEIRCFGTM